MSSLDCRNRWLPDKCIIKKSYDVAVFALQTFFLLNSQRDVTNWQFLGCSEMDREYTRHKSFRFIELQHHEQ